MRPDRPRTSSSAAGGRGSDSLERSSTDARYKKGARAAVFYSASCLLLTSILPAPHHHSCLLLTSILLLTNTLLSSSKDGPTFQPPTPHKHVPVNMKLSAVAGLVAMLGSATAAAPPPGSKPFQLMALRSASDIHFGQISAAQSNIFVNRRLKQGAVCKGEDPNRATFYLQNGELFLYTNSGLVQKVFVDRSGMGQGKIGFLSGNGPLPPHFEVKGWVIDKYDDLYFGKQNLLACPNADGWTVWLATDQLNPGGNENCLGFIPRTIPTPDAPRCKYSQN
ncbi:hypothetical protein CDD83_7708 [Cordyceps sp. RAO-2017]|nr:hypothetical protein CDD83_7708 [Cordyceps sp. RAO-2017]